MAYGINDTIQQKVDAYRGNPGALQQRYAQNKELIDLLALQKLKSEKDAAARDMQMKMQQKPQTIAQQYEAELAGRTKNEMLQGIAGVMQNRQAKQQANMQRMAQGTPPTAPKRMMAQGGIIGFASGNTPQSKLEKITEIRKRLARGIIDQDEADRLIEALAPTRTLQTKSDEVIGQGRASLTNPVVAAQLDYTKKMQGADERAAAAAEGAPKGGRLAGTATNAIADLDPSIGQYKNAGQNQILGATTNVSPPPAATAPEETPPVVLKDPPPAEQKPDPLMDQIEKIGTQDLTTRTVSPPASTLGKLTAPTVDMTKADELRSGLSDLYTGFMEANPEDMAKKRREDALNFLGLSDADKATRERNITERKAAEDEIKNIEKSRYGSEDKLRRDRLIQNLIGASGTTIGSTLASGAGSSIAERDKQRTGIDALRGERQGLMDKRITAEGANITERQGIKKDAFSAGQSGYEQGYNQIRAGAAGIKDLSNQAQSFAEKQADRILAAKQSNLTRDTANRQMELQANIKTAELASSNQLAKFKASLVRDTKIIEALMAREKNAIDAERNDVMRTGNTIKMQGVLGRVNQIISTVQQQYITAYAPLIQQAQALGDEADPTVAELQQAMEKAINQSTKELQGMIEDLERNISGGLPGQTPAGSTDGFTVTQKSP